MLLCSFLDALLIISLATLFRIAIFLQISTVAKVQAALPPGAEDEIILIEHLPGRRVHLQDFFWTGTEDAPPWVDPNQGIIFYETRTVYYPATIYPFDDEDTLQGKTPAEPSPREPECKSCIEPTPRLDGDDEDDDTIGILVGEDPGPRYWLLTVLRAGEEVPPKVELRLARLYRTAFSKQQQRHLGLITPDPRTGRNVKGRRAFLESRDAKAPLRVEKKLKAVNSIVTEPTTLDDENSESTTTIRAIKMIELPKFKRTLSQNFATDSLDSLEEFSRNEKIYQEFSESSNIFQKDIPPSLKHPEIFSTESTVELTTFVNFNNNYNGSTYQNNLQMDYLHPKLLNDEKNSHQSIFSTKFVSLQNENGIDNSRSRSKSRSSDRLNRGLVQVRMQNTSVIEGGATRLIYSVHLDGKPVPAETAARDMTLLSPQEVALELGAPVIIQSEPYLKETRPLALSRKRDAWLLIGAAGAAIVILGFIVAGFIVIIKRKRAHSAVAAPPSRSILKKEREYIMTTPGFDNSAFSTSETEVKSRSQTDGTSQRQTPGTLSRTPVTPATPDSRDGGDLRDDFSDDEEGENIERSKIRGSPWEIQDRTTKKRRISHGRMARTNAIDQPRTPDSIESIADRLDALDSFENGYSRQEEVLASPHSYLSMPSCKQFPNMRSVEPLSRVLEPVMVKHLDIDSPEEIRRNGDVDSRRGTRIEDKFLARSASETKDPGVIGPIVWNLRRQGLSTEGNGTSETDIDPLSVIPAGPVGRARRRLHELLEDSFSLFGSREPKSKDPQASTTRPGSATRQDSFIILSETRGKSANVSPVTSPTVDLKSRPRTSLPRKDLEAEIPETGLGEHPRGAWGSRPLSAGPFHRPHLPVVDTRRILTDAQLSPEDPAVPLIASIKKELEKFSPK